MPVKTFPPNPYKEAVKKALREGITPEGCASQFPVSVRTCWRYLQEVRAERPESMPDVKKQRSGAVRITIEMDSSDMIKTIDYLRLNFMSCTSQGVKPLS